MSGVKGKSGRKKVISTLMSEAVELVDESMPELFEKLKEKALAGDKDCLIYLIDRRLGRPRQEIDQRIKGQILITPDMRALAAREMMELKAEETKLLEE